MENTSREARGGMLQAIRTDARKGCDKNSEGWIASRSVSSWTDDEQASQLHINIFVYVYQYVHKKKREIVSSG